MGNVRVIYNGKEYIHLSQDASGYCKIVDVDTAEKIILVHFSELKPKIAFKSDKNFGKSSSN